MYCHVYKVKEVMPEMDSNGVNGLMRKGGLEPVRELSPT